MDVSVQHESVLAAFSRAPLRELALPTLIGAVVLLVSAALLLGENISAMRENLRWIRHTQSVLLQISAAEAGVVGDELTVRSYALTGDPRFLYYQKVERKKLADALRQLAAFASIEPPHAARVRQIADLVRRHNALYDTITGLGPAHADIVGKVINDDKKRAIMFATRGALASFRADEVKTMGERENALTQQLSHAFFYAIGIIIAAFLLGGVGLFVSQCGVTRRA